MDINNQLNNTYQIKPRKRTGAIIITIIIYLLSVAGFVTAIIVTRNSWKEDTNKFERDYNEIVEQYNTIVSGRVATIIE